MFYRTAQLKIKDKDLYLCGKDETKVCNCCGTQSCSFRQAAKRLIAVDPNFLYVIVSGLHGDSPNENGDYFEWDKNHFDWEKEVFGYEGELLNKRNGAYVYETWRGKPNLTNHDEKSVVGHIEDVFHILEEKSIDKLLAVNRRTQPLLVGDIEKGLINEVSMGCLVASSICSKCKHIAHDEQEWCFLPGTKVLMADYTLKNIETVCEGEHVITHKGNKKKVLKPMSRSYKGEILVITSVGDSGKYPLRLTPNHEIFTLQSNGSIGSGTVGFILAKEIQINNELLVPVVREQKTNLEVTEEESRLLGYYVSEGSIGNKNYKTTRQLSFSFNKSEAAYVTEVASLCTKLFNRQICVYENPKSSGVEIRTSVPLNVASKLQYIGGEYAKQKQLVGEFVEQPLDIVKAFLDTYNNGDGWKNAKGFSFETASEQLAYQLVILGRRFGGSVYWNKLPNTHSPTNPVKDLTIYRVNIKPLINVVRYLSYDGIGYFKRLVRDIKSERYSGLVYNLEVEDDNSYIANDVAVHNCDHLKYHKGRLDDEGSKIYEINKGVVGQECSWITMGQAADPKATKKKIVAEKEEEMSTFKINPIAGKRSVEAGVSSETSVPAGGIKNAIAYESDMSRFTGMKKEKGMAGVSPEMQTKLALLAKIPVDKLIGLVDDKDVKEILAQTMTSSTVAEEKETIATEIEKLEKEIVKPVVAESLGNVKEEIAKRKEILAGLYKKEEAMKGTNAVRRISAEIIRLEDEVTELEKQEPAVATKGRTMNSFRDVDVSKIDEFKRLYDWDQFDDLWQKAVEKALTIIDEKDYKVFQEVLQDIPTSAAEDITTPNALARYLFNYVERYKRTPLLEEASMDINALAKMIKETVRAEMKSLKAQFGEEKDKDKDLTELPEPALEKPKVDKKEIPKETKDEPSDESLELEDKKEEKPATPKKELQKDLEEGANIESGKAKEIVTDIEKIVKDEVKKTKLSKPEEKEVVEMEPKEETEEPLMDEDLDLNFIEGKRKSESKWIVRAKKKPVFSVNLKQAFDTDSWSKNWKFFSSKEYGKELREAIKEKGIKRTIVEEFPAGVTRLSQVELPPETPTTQPVGQAPQAVLPPQSQQQILEGPKAKGSFVKFLTNMTAPLIALDTPVFDVDSITTELTSTFGDEAATNQFKGELEAKVQSLKEPKEGVPAQPITTAKSIKALKKALFEEFQKVKPTISEDEVWLIYSAGDSEFKRELLKGGERITALKGELNKEISAHKRTQASLENLLEERSLRFKARKAVELVDREIIVGLVDTKETLMAKGEKDERVATKTAKEIYEHEVDELVAMDDKTFNSFTKKVEAMLKETKMTKRASIGKVIGSLVDATTDDEPRASIEGSKSTTLETVWSRPPIVNENEK